MATKTRKRAKVEPIKDDVTVRVKGRIVPMCSVCKEPFEEHEQGEKERDWICPAGTTKFKQGAPKYEIRIVTSQSSKWVYLDVKDSLKFYDRHPTFGWSQDIRDYEDACAQTAYGILLGCDLEPDWIDDHFVNLFETLMALQHDTFDFTVRNVKDWSEKSLDWDIVDWHDQDPR